MQKMSAGEKKSHHKNQIKILIFCKLPYVFTFLHLNFMMLNKIRKTFSIWQEYNPLHLLSAEKQIFQKQILEIMKDGILTGNPMIFKIPTNI